MAITELEQVSTTFLLAQAMEDWEQSGDCSLLGFLGSRLFIVIGSPFSAIFDVGIHIIFAAVKIVPAILVAPYNFIARRIDTSYTSNEELYLESVIKHIFIVFKSCIFVPVICITGAFSPELAKENANIANILVSKYLRTRCLATQYPSFQEDFTF